MNTPDRNNEPWFKTVTGLKFYPMNPRPEEIRLDDIAHGLAKTARFNGHTFEFYSVAQHSVIVSQHVRPEHALYGLLHDAAEAYIGDLIRPVKKAPGLATFAEIEAKIMAVIAEAFFLKWPMNMAATDDVQQADEYTLYTEDRDLRHRAWTDRPTWPERIEPIEWRPARALFIERFYQLIEGKEPREWQP